jgi:ubiquinone/menaquinone biosynthesis C-methylase UbiE
VIFHYCLSGIVVNNSDEQSSRVVKYYEKASGNYDEEYESAYWKELYAKITWHYIEPYLPKEGLVLDAGGGTGRWAIPMAEKALKVIIYDVSKEMLDVALRKARERKLEELIQVKVGDICNIDFPDNHFDFVLAEGDPISYCSNPEKALEELSRVLRPNCFISAGVDSLFPWIRRALTANQDPEGAMRILREKRFYADSSGFHCWVFAPRDLRTLFEKHGLEVKKLAGKTVLYSREMEPLLQNSEKVERLLDMELMLCEEESIVGYGGHLQIVARKS